MPKNKEVTSSKDEETKTQSILKLTEAITRAFGDRIKEIGEFDEAQFLDEMEGVRKSLDPDEVEIFDLQIQTSLRVLRLFFIIEVGN